MTIYAFGMFFACLDSAAGSVLRVMDRFGLAFAAGTTGIAGRLALIVLVVALGGGLEAIVWARVGGEVLLALLQGAATVAVLTPAAAATAGAPRSRCSVSAAARSGPSCSTPTSPASRGWRPRSSTRCSSVRSRRLRSSASTSSAFSSAGCPRSRPTRCTSPCSPPWRATSPEAGCARSATPRATRSVLMAACMLPVLIVGGLFGERDHRRHRGRLLPGRGHARCSCACWESRPLVVFYWLPPLLLTTGHTGALLRTVIAGTIVQLAALVVLVPSLDASGAATRVRARELL